MMGLIILEEQMQEIQSMLCDCITILDEGGRSNDRGNSKMLWNYEWEELREKVYELFIKASIRKYDNGMTDSP